MARGASSVTSTRWASGESSGISRTVQNTLGQFLYQPHWVRPSIRRDRTHSGDHIIASAGFLLESVKLAVAAGISHQLRRLGDAEQHELKLVVGFAEIETAQLQRAIGVPGADGVSARCPRKNRGTPPAASRLEK